uniref:putative reverse transcriptase/maturase n=1 Tax=Rhodospora sordida TaxID=362230 RepID=UPI001FCE0DA8|nr:putative reverse transcriptase/maturase [Rhodospora sordida]UNJ14925.1 putative reverse transcriptase/maturase [Rhodospora sordida]
MLRRKFTMVEVSAGADKVWKDLPWKKFQKILFNLQSRIYKAKRRGDYPEVIKLQRLLITSKSAQFLSVRQLSSLSWRNTIVHKSKFIPLSIKNRFKLVQELSLIKNWSNNKLLKIYASEFNNEAHYITIKKLSLQCLVKYTVESFLDTHFLANWTNSRFKNIEWDTQRVILDQLKTYKPTKVLKLNLDFEEYLRQIDYHKLMSQLILPRFIKFAMLKVLKSKKTILLKKYPWGKDLSCTLFNLFLEQVRRVGESIHYKNSVIFLLKATDEVDELFKKIQYFLDQMGLDNEVFNTERVQVAKGFDFLNWHFKVKKNHTIISIPNRNNRIHIKRIIKETLRDTRFPIEKRLENVKIQYKCWYNYHQFCRMYFIKSFLWGLRKSSFKYLRKVTCMNLKESTRYICRIFNSQNE